MPINLSDVSEADLTACLAIDPRRTGVELVGEAAALRVWKELIRHPFFTAVTVLRDEDRRQIVGSAAACLVSAQFTDAELSDPRAGTNARFIENLAGVYS